MKNNDIKIIAIITENIGDKIKFDIIQLTDNPFIVIKMNGTVAIVALIDTAIASPNCLGKKTNFFLKKLLKKYIPKTPA